MTDLGSVHGHGGAAAGAAPILSSAFAVALAALAPARHVFALAAIFAQPPAATLARVDRVQAPAYLWPKLP